MSRRFDPKLQPVAMPIRPARMVACILRMICARYAFIVDSVVPVTRDLFVKLALDQDRHEQPLAIGEWFQPFTQVGECAFLFPPYPVGCECVLNDIDQS
jgi:hypothetical protein